MRKNAGSLPPRDSRAARSIRDWISRLLPSLASMAARSRRAAVSPSRRPSASRLRRSRSDSASDLCCEPGICAAPVISSSTSLSSTDASSHRLWMATSSSSNSARCRLILSSVFSCTSTLSFSSHRSSKTSSPSLASSVADEFEIGACGGFAWFGPSRSVVAVVAGVEFTFVASSFGAAGAGWWWCSSVCLASGAVPVFVLPPKNESLGAPLPDLASLSSLRRPATSSCSCSMARCASPGCVATCSTLVRTFVLISFALSAYFNVLIVWLYWSLPHDTLATIAVLELPTSPSFSSLVSLEFLNGTYTPAPCCFFPRALMQFASASNDRLMFAPSLSLLPSFFVSDARSEPARSTRDSRPVSTSILPPPPPPPPEPAPPPPAASGGCTRLNRRTLISITAWDRDETALASVGSVFRLALPSLKTSNTLSAFVTDIRLRPVTVAPRSGSSRRSSDGELFTRRSYMSSLYTSR